MFFRKTVFSHFMFFLRFLSRPGGVARHRDYIFTFRNLRFSKSILVTTVCLFVSLFVCVSVLEGCTGHTAGRIVMIFLTADVFRSKDLGNVF